MAGDGDLSDPQAAGSVSPSPKLPVRMRRTADRGEVGSDCLPLMCMMAALHAHVDPLGVVLHVCAML